MEPTDSTGYRYWAFISYSSHDKAWADWLHRSIESYGIPSRLINHPTPTGEAAPKRLRPVFRDRAELAASPDLGREIEEALGASRYLIVICSPAAARSKWVNTEIEGFQRLGRADRVLALIVDGEPHAGGDRECFPPALLAAEPIAADARREGDGKDNARLKLLAGMLGIGFDALKQREAHRRIRRLQIGIALLSAIVVAVTALAVYAEGQRVKAVTARQQAEGLVQYMLFDLRGQLLTIGRLDIFRNAQDLVDQYYRQLGPEAGDASASRNHVSALVYKGADLQDQGDLPGALQQYRAALAINESLASSDPYWESDRALIHSSIGFATELQGDLAGALREYGTELEIYTRLASSYPDTPAWQSRKAKALVSIGGVLRSQGDLAGALQRYRAAAAVSEGLLSSVDMTDAEWQADLASARSWIGAVLQDQGDLAGALREYRAVLAINESLASSDVGNAFAQRNLYFSHASVGGVLRSRGDLAGALAEYREALAVSERLLATVDAGNRDWRLDAAAGHSSVASVLQQQGDLAGALKEYRAALSVAESLASSDPSNVEVQRQLYWSLTSVGDVLEQQSDLVGALRQYRAALTAAESLASSVPGDAETRADLYFSHSSLGRVLERQGDLSAALRERRAALAAAESLASLDPSDTTAQEDLYFSHASIGSTLVASGDIAGALLEYRVALDISKRQASSDPGDGEWQKRVSEMERVEGELLAPRR